MHFRVHFRVAGVALLEVGDSGILSATRLLLRDNNLVIVGELVHASRFQLISRAEHLQNIRKVRARRGWAMGAREARGARGGVGPATCALTRCVERRAVRFALYVYGR